MRLAADDEQIHNEKRDQHRKGGDHKSDGVSDMYTSIRKGL